MPDRPWWLRWPPEEQRRRWAAEGRCPRCGSTEIRRAGRRPLPGRGSGATASPGERGGGLVEGGCYEPGVTPNATCLRCGFRFRMIG